MQAAQQNSVSVITGASSGIGAALARRLSRRSGAILGLIGRDVRRLEAIAAECRAAGAIVETGVLDVRDRSALATWLEAFDRAHPIDCVVANAGISAGSLPGGHPERAGQAHDVFDVNLGGTLNLVVPIVPAMQTRRRGRVVLISSLAAFAPLPEAAAYSASKAAILNFGLALRHALGADGIRVNVICPGFVTTPMSQSFRGWKPLEIGPDDAAGRILRAMEQDKAVTAFPWPLALAARLSAFVPEALVSQAMRLFHLA